MAQDKMNIQFRIKAVDRFTKTMERLESKMDSVERSSAKLDAMSPDIEVDADIDDYMKGAATVKASAEALDSTNVVIDMKARYKRFRRSVDRIADAARDVGVIARSQLLSALLTIAPAAVPSIASLTGAIMALGNSIGVTAGGAFGLANAFGVAGAGAAAFGGLAATNIGKVVEANQKLKELEEELSNTSDQEKRAEIMQQISDVQGGLNDEQKASIKAMSSLSGLWGDIAKSLETETLNSFINFLRAAETGLRLLRPTFEAAASSAETLSDYLAGEMVSPDVLDFFRTLGDNVEPIMNNMGKAVMDFGFGLLNMMNAFMPLSKQMSGGFRQMASDFRSWADGLKSSQSFQAFMDYIRTNGPVLLDIFGSLTVGIIDMFAAFGPSSEEMLSGLQDLINRFQDWASTLSESDSFQQFVDYMMKNGPNVVSVIGEFVDFLVNLGIAFAPLGSKMLEFLDGFLALANGFMENNRVISQIIAVFMSLVAVFSLVIPWILMIKSRLIPVVAIFKKVGSVVKNLRFASLAKALGKIPGPIGLVITAITLFVTALISMWKNNEAFRQKVITIWNAIKLAITVAITQVRTFIMSIWNQIKEFWNQNQNSILAAARNVWTVIQVVINTVLTVIMGIFKVVWPFILILVRSTWEAIKMVIQGAITVILGIIKFFSSLFTGNWKGMWEAIKMIISGAIEAVLGFIILWIGKFLKIFKGLFTGLKKVVKSGWSRISGTFQMVVAYIWNFVKSAFRSGLNFVVNLMGKLRSGIGSAWNWIKDKVYGGASYIWNTIKDRFVRSKNFVSDSMHDLRNIFSIIWDRIRGKISEVLSLIRNIVSKRFNAVKDKISSVLDGAKRIVSRAVDSIKGFFDINLFDSGKAMIDSVKRGITSAKDAAIRKVKEIAGNIRDLWPFSPAKEGPLKDINKMDFAGPITDSIDKSETPILRKMQGLVQLPDVNNPYSDPRNRAGMSRHSKDEGEGDTYEIPVAMNVDGRQLVKSTVHLTDKELKNRRKKSKKSKGDAKLR